MVILSTQDFYKVKLSSLIADYDKDTLTSLYQPLIGHTALSVYFTLWSEAKKQDLKSLTMHENLLVSMQIATGEFIEARKKLEAVGLLRTYLKKSNDVNLYYYELYAPKTPNGFFDDALLFGLLIKYVGEKSANKLRSIYGISIDLDRGDDVSSTFGEVFKPDFNDNVFLKAINNKDKIIDRRQSKIDSEFNFGRFINKIKESSQISDSVFTKEVLKEIERLTALYGIDEETAALRVIDVFDANRPNGEKIDFKKLIEMFQEDVKYPFLNTIKKESPNLNSGDSNLAKKINLMETISPKDYLRILQNNTQPVKPDLRLIDDLSSNLKLPNCVINAIIDYVLTKNDNVLSRALTEKVASSLAREGVTTTIDAMEFLNKTKKKKRIIQESTKPVLDSEKKDVSDNENKKTDTQDIDWDSL
ncbi:MAG: DnaD domain protein [Erysipelotrichaceae bacterium]|nr:DnaD domain protein [Erysipelotrichaceae bacterium]